MTMADRLGSKLHFRSRDLSDQESGSDDSSRPQARDKRPHNRSNDDDYSSSLSSGANSLASAGSDDEHNSDEEGKNEDVILVRSTISRDTTRGGQAVDLVDLTKLAVQASLDLPLNTTGSRAGGSNIPPPLPPPIHQPIIHDRGYLPPQGVAVPPPPPGYLGGPPPPQPLYAAPLPYFDLHPGPPLQVDSILARLRPGDVGRDSRAFFKESWSDRQQFSPYNWRDRLRISGRRKSESDLKSASLSSDDSWISQHLSPNAAMRRLVSTWKMAGIEIEKRTDGASMTNFPPSQIALGAELGKTAENQFGLDLYDNSAQSMYISHLLDTIEALRAERNFLGNVLTRPQEMPESPSDSEDSDAEYEVVPQLKVLHRIFCKAPQHVHDQTIFEDVPLRAFSERTQDLALGGSIIIRNLSHYCSQNPNISLIVFKEHLCVEDPVPRSAWRRYVRDSNGTNISPRSERMVVVSELLQKALDHVATCSAPESRSSFQGKSEMTAPYLFLYHHRDALAQHRDQSTGLVQENISVLLDFIQADYDAEYREATLEFSKGNLTDNNIEKLWRPNDIVVEDSDEAHRAFVIRDWPEIIKDEMRLSCWAWKYDGICLQRVDKCLKIPLPLKEGAKVSQLPFCPISMAGDAVIEVLRKRGEKFWSMKDQYFGCFTGLDINRSQRHHHIRIMVDMFTYSRMHSETGFLASGLVPSRFDTWPVKISRDKELDDNMLLLLPPTVFGFMLTEKTWRKFDLDGIHEIEWNKDAFSRLVLDSKTKELITALVEIRIKTGRAEDIIGGKGNGLMILLHGGPGTGKTLTAESVAEIAEKPLYRVTCGDIGTKADDVEKYLQTVLYLGKLWNCVLLLDEADIFLEERTIADLERNSLVSVFLRILEYYDGILIMTSNRVGTFDEAFKSRIQVSLHYEDLTKKAKRTIWSNFITMLEDGGQDVNIGDLESHLGELADEEMNGRQIRNAMTTARQLALHRKERLQWEHLDQVLRTAREFNSYLKRVQGHTDKQWAREHGLR